MIKEKIAQGYTFLGIELGSTRIKSCLIDDSYMPIASGCYEWENKFENGYWTYSIDEIFKGTKESYASLCKDVLEKYNINLTKMGGIGISGMMHGYLAFDDEDKLLVPFRTWRNTTTEKAASELTDLFNFNIPQRWSIAHLYQAILNGEEHVNRIAHITTLSGYIHYLLTGRWEVGVCEASGMFPILGNEYNPEMLDKFERLISKYDLTWNIRDILPKVKVCGEAGAMLIQSGADFLDISGKLSAGIPVCPPEGDAGTGMVATNSVKPKTGNISAGTSVFSMLVLEKQLKGKYEKIDVVTTPDAFPVAMVHSNNGCSEIDVWVKIFGEFALMIGAEIDKSKIYKLLYENTLSGDSDCGGVISYNFLASEPVAGIKNGFPMYLRMPQSKMNLANFFRSQLYATVAVLKIGMDILVENENISADCFNAHGGLFKVKGVAQQILANALNTAVSVSGTSGEGGAWGMALLAAYMIKSENHSLGDWLDAKVFGNIEKTVLLPDPKSVEGFNSFFELYKSYAGCS
ncbi:MAG: ATPase [Ruminococcaceae bacterium]|nr:ATPase [Oscillospiraceae bacterium]